VLEIIGVRQLTINGSPQLLNSALAGFGPAYLPEDLVRQYLKEQRRKRVLEDWCAADAGYHLYYPSRRHTSAALTVLVEALRYRSYSLHAHIP